jgi:hypothetical protein
MDRRLILFLELVRGCNNVECPSWGSVCQYDGQQYMSLETLGRVSKEVKEAIEDFPFKTVDIWTYGCGDSLDHPEVDKMLNVVRKEFDSVGKISMAIDSHRDVLPGKWWKYLDKVKIIHKQAETFDWVTEARKWSTLPRQMSHKLITNKITKSMWKSWKEEDFITELKAVPWHDIQLATDSPVFTQRANISFEEGVPFKEGPYPGFPVRRAMINWDGTIRRCLVSPTEYTSIHELITGPDKVCYTCFPLTGGGLAKFYDDCVVSTPSANCVSDGYFSLGFPGVD